MSQDEYDRWRQTVDPRRAYGLDELPADFARELAASLEAVTRILPHHQPAAASGPPQGDHI